jgi:GNAT superfamily N-acetyltransferase
VDDEQDVVIRTAVAEDLDPLRAVYRRASLSNRGDRQALLATVDALLWSPDGAVTPDTLLAQDSSGTVLGFATARRDADAFELEDLFVDPPAMRRGVGTRLVEAIVARAGSEGISRIEVTGNQHASDFYASVGFTQVGTAQTRFAPAARLRKDLDQTP